MIIMSFLILFPLFYSPFECLMGLFMVATGVPVYCLGVLWKSKPRSVQRWISKFDAYKNSSLSDNPNPMLRSYISWYWTRWYPSDSSLTILQCNSFCDRIAMVKGARTFFIHYLAINNHRWLSMRPQNCCKNCQVKDIGSCLLQSSSRNFSPRHIFWLPASLMPAIYFLCSEAWPLKLALSLLGSAVGRTDVQAWKANH